MSISRFFPLMILFLVVVFSTGTAKADHPTFATAILEKSDNPVNQKFLELIYQNKLKQLDEMLAAGANPNVSDSKRVSPIHYAARSGNVEALKRLYDKGANLETAVFGGWTAFHYAAFSGHIAVVRFLVSVGALREAADVGGETPLF